MEIEFQEDKFRELILYIALRSESDRKFGAVKLNKILFYSDFNAYRESGQPITGADYQHIGEGPAPRNFLPIRRRMLAADEIKIESRPYMTKFQKRIVAKRPPDLSKFTTDEIRIVDEVISEFWELNATEVTDLSHEEYGWRLTDDGESIPYTAALFSADQLTQEQIEVGQEIAAKHELKA